MSPALTIIIAVVALGLLYVVVPVMGDVYRRFTGKRTVTCPETKDQAEVEVDAVRAALTAATGPPDLEVRHCSHWPERQDCGQECREQLARPGTSS